MQSVLWQAQLSEGVFMLPACITMFVSAQPFPTAGKLASDRLLIMRVSCCWYYAVAAHEEGQNYDGIAASRRAPRARADCGYLFRPAPAGRRGLQLHDAAHGGLQRGGEAQDEAELDGGSARGDQELPLRPVALRQRLLKRATPGGASGL